MANTIAYATKEVTKSEFKMFEDGSIEVNNAVIVWKNFAGNANRFGNTTREFSLVVSQDFAEELIKKGWNVKSYSNGEDEMLYITIKVNMESAFPPSVVLFTDFHGKKTRTNLDETTIADLDKIRIVPESTSLSVNGYRSKMFPDKVTGYLKKLYVIQEPVIEFGGKYDDWMVGTANSDDTPWED